MVSPVCPAIDLERAGTDRLGAEVRAQFLHRGLRHDRQVHVRQERRERRLQRERDRVLVGRVDFVDGQVERAEWRVEGLIEDRLVGEFDVGGGEVRAVVEFDALAQMEDPGLVVGVVPLFGQVGHGRVVGIDRHQAVEGKLLHAEARGVLGQPRVERVGIDVEADAQRAAPPPARGCVGCA